MKKILLLISSLLTLLFLSGCGEEATTIVEDNGSFEDLKVQGNKNFELKTTDGKTIPFNIENNVLTSKELSGKYVMFNFWATWCAPCIQEMPILTKLQEKNTDKFQIIGVLMEKDKDPKKLEEFMTTFKMNFPVTVGDENYRMAKTFDGVKMFPESFLYGSNGKFIKKFVGEVTEKEILEIINK
jgi:thiol-disulfide isomerase/thioredoxin